MTHNHTAPLKGLVAAPHTLDRLRGLSKEFHLLKILNARTQHREFGTRGNQPQSNQPGGRSPAPWSHSIFARLDACNE